MSNKSLREAISILYDMEINNYFMLQGVQKLEAEEATLCLSNKYQLPIKTNYHLDIKDNFKSGVLSGIVYGLIIGIVLAAITSMYSILVVFFDFPYFIRTVLLSMLFVFLASTIIFFIDDLWATHKSQKKEDKQFEADIAKYNSLTPANSNRLKKEYKRRIICRKHVLICMRD